MMPCNLCGTPTVHRENSILYIGGAVDLEEYDWCIICSHTVRGSIKRVQ